MQNVFDIEASTNILQDDSYVISYQHIVGFFANKSTFSESDVVCGAHMAYGWMPTILKLYPDQKNIDLPKAAKLLTEGKTNGYLTAEQLEELASLVNKSLVGASKLLHFVAPANFAIWDSKVYSFVHGERPHNYSVNDAKKYLDYLNLLTNLSKDARFANFYFSVKSKLGYEVTPFRALELVMFLRAPVY